MLTCCQLNKEIKRRTRVATLFPNPESCVAPHQRHAGRARRRVDDGENLPDNDGLITKSTQCTKHEITESLLLYLKFVCKLHSLAVADQCSARVACVLGFCVLNDAAAAGVSALS